MKMWPSNPSDDPPKEEPQERPSAPSGSWWDDTWDDVPAPRFVPRVGTQAARVPWDVAKEQIKRLIRFMRRGGTLPSKCDFEPWVWATERAGEKLSDPKKVGKWLIFVPADEVDEVWARIDEAHSNALLGVDAKVSTRMVRNVEGTHVICVYTENWMDEDDVWRVRDALADLGFEKTLYYKRDVDTIAGKKTHTYKG